MIKGGDLDGALAAIDPLMDSEYARIATVWRGCILVQRTNAGRCNDA